MTEDGYNANDVLYLFSCGLDESLSAEQQRIVETAFANSPPLRSQAEALRATAEVVARLSRQPVDCDWSRHEQSIRDQIDDDASDEFGQLDSLIARWSATTPSYDAEAFTADVMASVDLAGKHGGVSKVLFRIGAPLAAAAAIALAIVGTLWFQTPSVSTVHVVYQSSIADTEGTSDGGGPESYVAYHREMGRRSEVGDDLSGLSFISVGASPLSEEFEERPPI